MLNKYSNNFKLNSGIDENTVLLQNGDCLIENKKFHFPFTVGRAFQMFSKLRKCREDVSISEIQNICSLCNI